MLRDKLQNLVYPVMRGVLAGIKQSIWRRSCQQKQLKRLANIQRKRREQTLKAALAIWKASRPKVVEDGTELLYTSQQLPRNNNRISIMKQKTVLGDSKSKGSVRYSNAKAILGKNKSAGRNSKISEIKVDNLSNKDPSFQLTQSAEKVEFMANTT